MKWRSVFFNISSALHDAGSPLGAPCLSTARTVLVYCLIAVPSSSYCVLNKMWYWLVRRVVPLIYLLLNCLFVYLCLRASTQSITLHMFAEVWRFSPFLRHKQITEISKSSPVLLITAQLSSNSFPKWRNYNFFE